MSFVQLLMKFRHYVWAAVVGLLAAPVCAATFSSAEVKAAYLHRFASYVEWPAAAPGDGPFLIGVNGADEVANHLERLLVGVTVNGRRAELRRVERAQDLPGVHILYIGPQSLARSRSVREAAVQLPILLVTDDASGFEAGGVINFIEVNRNVRFEISLNAADRSGLKINSALLSVAARVERRPQAWSGCADPYTRRYRAGTCLIRLAAVDVRGWR